MKEEKALNEFLQAWKNQDWNLMFKRSQITWQKNHPETEGIEFLKCSFGFKDLQEWKIIEKNKISDVCYKITVEIKYRKPSLIYIKRKVKAMLICEIEPYKTGVEGEFGINPISILKEFK